MKVLLVSRWLWEERRRNGGHAGFFGELAQTIAVKGIDLTILSQADDAGLIPEFRPVDGLKVYVFSRERRHPVFALFDKIVKIWAGYRKGVTDAAAIRRFVWQHGPFDAIVAQCEEPDGLACVLAFLDSRFPPLITCVHDLRYQFDEKSVRFMHKASLGFIFKKSARIMANSTQTTTWLQREYNVPAAKIGQCRIHLTSPFLHAATERATAIDPAGRRILFLGALNRKKAPDVFLRAAAILAPELPDWTFVMVGPETSEDEAFRAFLKELAANPVLAGRVEWLGRLESTSVVDQILRARVVVCPSRIETFSRTTIEALALGRPVVVSETTGAADWVKKTGCGSIVPSDNPNALAGAIREWTSSQKTVLSPGTIVAELTAARAAEDWIEEVHLALI